MGLGNIWYLWQRQTVDLAGKGAVGRFHKPQRDLRAHLHLREEKTVWCEGVGVCSIMGVFHVSISVAATQVVSRAKVSPDVHPPHSGEQAFQGIL